MTSYGPAATMITNKQRGFIFDPNNIGIADFSDKKHAKFVYWHSNWISGKILSGENPLDLAQLVSTTIGTMKPLPEWIQKGIIVGMVNGFLFEEVSKASLFPDPIFKLLTLCFVEVLNVIQDRACMDVRNVIVVGELLCVETLAGEGLSENGDLERF